MKSTDIYRASPINGEQQRRTRFGLHQAREGDSWLGFDHTNSTSMY